MRTRTHKIILIKSKPGHNPSQALCGGNDKDVFTLMAKDWKDVDCQKCHMIRGGKAESPYIIVKAWEIGK